MDDQDSREVRSPALEKVGTASKPNQHDRRRAKADETTRASQEIIAGESAARDQNRARLKADRLAKEATQPPKAPKAPARKARSKKTEG